MICYPCIFKLQGASSGGLGFNYERDVVRQGALHLITLTAKGYVYHVVNIILLILLVMFLVEYHKTLKGPEVTNNIEFIIKNNKKQMKI